MADQPAQFTQPAIPAKAPGAYRVLHTADWHLGKMLGEHSRAEEHARFLSFLLDGIRRFSVDALVVAGDIFDSANPPQSAAAQYYDFLSCLFRQGGCSVVVVAGNHDSPAHLEAPRQVLRALRAYVLGTLAGAPSDWLVPLPSPEAAQLVVAGMPFLRDRDLRTGQPGQGAAEIRKELLEGITRRYQEAAEATREWAAQGVPLLATGHLAVLGSTTCDSEREIHVGGLGAVGVDCFPGVFAYVALGHLHRPQPAGGREVVRYAGSPIPLSFSEADDAKEVRLLDFGQGRLLWQAPLNVPVSRPLAQFRCRRESLEMELVGFRPPAGALPAWVEVVVEDPVAGENLFDLVQERVKGLDFKVIRVVCRRTTPLPSMTASDQAAAEGIDQLLGDPAKTFGHRLEAESGLAEAERTALRTVFAELCSLHAEQQRNGEAAR